MSKAEIFALIREQPEAVEITSTGKLTLRLTPSDAKAAQIIEWIEDNLIDDETTVGDIQCWLEDAIFWVKLLGAMAANKQQ